VESFSEVRNKLQQSLSPFFIYLSVYDLWISLSCLLAAVHGYHFNCLTGKKFRLCLSHQSKKLRWTQILSSHAGLITPLLISYRLPLPPSAIWPHLTDTWKSLCLTYSWLINSEVMGFVWLFSKPTIIKLCNRVCKDCYKTGWEKEHVNVKWRGRGKRPTGRPNT